MSLRLASVSHRYGARAALKEVSLHVRRGDCYGFIGHNGAGKTTALRLALGLMPVQSGRVLVDGFDAAAFPREARARLGGLVEVPGFQPGLSGLANLRLLGGLQGFDRRRAKGEAERVLDLVGLTENAGRAVRGYSQGMRQRLGIAQALLGAPPYVLLDEPTNGLDPEGIADMRALLLRLTRDEGATVLLSSHQLHELSGLCNRIGVLKQGRLLVEAETDELLGAGARYAVRADDAGAARAALAELGLAVEAQPDGALLVDLGERPPGDVATALVRGGCALSAFAPRTPSLEEIYLRFTGNERATPESATGPAAAPPAERRAPSLPTLRVTRYEAKRLVSGATVPIVLLLPALLGALRVWHRWHQVRSERRAMEAGALFGTTDVTAFEGIGVGLQFAVPLAAVLLAGLASQTLAGELSRGTLRNLLLRPVGRLPAVFGKALGQLGAVVACYALLVGVVVASSALAFDFGDVQELLPNGLVFPLLEAEEVWPELRRAWHAPFLPLLACASVGLAAGALVRSSIGALALALGSFPALFLARAIARPLGVEAWLPTAHLPFPVADTSYVATYVDFCRGVSNPLQPASQSPGLVSLVWLFASLVFAALLTRRRAVP